ncbi:MAG: hypothetical protein HN348_26670 [Proteobacteria bacterium]|jgi:hypothetical protein|nr:hypothetical protein [Pseudomonadota bacterium]
MHIYRWDLDRTYLDTEIDSVRGLLRTAFESASRKKNIPGSATLLRALTTHDSRARVHILSGSPTQMRHVLEQKLALDGIRVDSLTLKDNLGHLRHGRLRAVKDQLGYKLPHLLRQRVGLGNAVKETLFGDDTEVDPLVYVVYSDAIAGRLDEATLTRILEAKAAYPRAIDESLRALEQIGTSDAVEDIFIHIDRGVPIGDLRLLGQRITPVFSWFQAAVVLWTRGRIDIKGVVDVARTCTLESSLDQYGLAGLFQDMYRRRLATEKQVETLLADEAFNPVQTATIALLSQLGEPPTPTIVAVPDYFAFLRVIHH